MSSTTIRINQSAEKTLKSLAASAGESIQATLDKAIEALRRQRFMEKVNAAYGAFKNDAKAWKHELGERHLWDSTLMDGLNPDEAWMSDGTIAHRRKKAKRNG